MVDRFDRIAPGRAAKAHLLFDTLAVLVCLGLAAREGPASLIAAPSATVLLATLALLTWLFGTAIVRLYSPCTPRTPRDGVLLGGLIAAGSAASAGLPTYLAPELFPSIAPGVLVACLFLATATTHVVFARFRKRAIDEDSAALIVGTGPLGAVTYERLVEREEPHRRVVGFLRLPGDPATVEGAAAPVLGEASELLDVLGHVVVHEVYIAAHVLEQGTSMQAAVRACEEVGAPFAVPVHSLWLERAMLLSSSPSRDGYLHYVMSNPRPRTYAVKRLLDIVIAGSALIVLSPLLVAFALAIKLTSRGPVLYKQTRVGLHGALFNLFKFRSMVQDADALRAALEAQNEQTGPVFKIKDDPRVTRVGHFMRKHSIDELPQLVNVLRGDMTLVGPRPPLPCEVTQYKAWQRRRLSVRPGLTCFWQVGGRDSIGFEEWMRLDLRYIDNWSLRTDLLLIARTVPAVLGGRGAS